MLKTRVVIITLSFILICLLFFVYFSAELSRKTLMQDQVIQLCDDDLQLILPTGWNEPFYKNGCSVNYFFNLTNVRYQSPLFIGNEEIIASFSIFPIKGAQNIQRFYINHLGDLEDFTAKELTKINESHYKTEVLEYHVERILINAAQVFIFKYTVGEEYPLGRFNESCYWNVYYYTPQIILILSFYVACDSASSLESVFMRIIDSIVLPYYD